MAESSPAAPTDDVESLWLATTPETDYDRLDGDRAVDVAVVGGGITGLSTALDLVDAGYEVAVIEADHIGTGTTGHTTAKLTSQHGLKYAKLCRQFGRRRAKQYAEANEAAIDHVEGRLEEFDVDAAFERTPAFVFAESEDDVEDLQDEASAARRLGLPVTFVDRVDVPFEVAGALRFDDQAQFHPREYLLAVANAIDSEGGHVFERTRAVSLDDGAPCRVETNRGTVTANHVVVASHFPFTDRGGYFARMHPSRSYLLAVELASDPPTGMYLGTASPSPTFRPHPMAESALLIVGGQGHKPSASGPPTSERYRRCEEYARERFDVEAVRYRWSAHDYVPVDDVPYIGKLAPGTENVYIAAGFAKWGLTAGTAAGLILTDLIDEGTSQWEEVFDPLRFVPSADSLLRDALRTVPSGVTFAAENATVGLRWFGDRAKSLLSIGDTDAALPDRGVGKIIRHRGKPLAVYRDDEGELHVSSAVCPHLWCLVEWNDAERTWDCPCHGSRFDCDGSLERGPALEDLPPREL